MKTFLAWNPALPGLVFVFHPRVRFHSLKHVHLVPRRGFRLSPFQCGSVCATALASKRPPPTHPNTPTGVFLHSHFPPSAHSRLNSAVVQSGASHVFTHTMDAPRSDVEKCALTKHERGCKLTLLVALQNALLVGCLLTVLYLYWTANHRQDPVSS